MEKKMTKKAFREGCSFHTYTGNRVRYKVIYYDWKDNFSDKTATKHWVGFKYAILEKANVKAKDIFNMFYDWVVNGVHPSGILVDTWYAETDEKRFKIPIGITF